MWDRTPGKVYGIWMIKFSKICFHPNSIFLNIENPRNVLIKSAKFFVFILLTRRTLTLIVNKENPFVFYFEEKMFTNEIKDGREAP